MNWKIVRQGSRGFYCELQASVGRLEMDFAAGRSNLNSHLSSLKELQSVTYRRSIRPWFVRAWWAASIGLLLLVFSNGADDLLCEQAVATANMLDGMSELGIASLVLAAVQFHVFFRREAEHDKLFKGHSGFVDWPGPSNRRLPEEGQG